MIRLRDGASRCTDVVQAVAVAWLITAAAMVCWSVLPLAWGWKPTVVLTGSMAPSLNPGDVVLVDPRSHLVQRGSIVMVRDSAMSSGSVVHRVRSVDESGRLITQGDANGSPDTTRRDPADVAGVARLVVPHAGRLTLLRSGHGSRTDWVLASGTLAAAGVVLLPRPSATQPDPDRSP